MKTINVALSALLTFPVSARVAWIPEEFDPSERSTVMAGLITRDASSGAASCGATFPSDFSCPQATQCLALNTTSSVQAVLCCPAGQDCKTIAPISCAQSAQNATLTPDSQLHADPTVALETCGSACCPMGYTCQGGTCSAQTAPIPATALTPAAPTTPASTSSSTGPPTVAPAVPTSQSTPATTTPAGIITNGAASSGSSKFSGSSFAAGFVPGIFLGVLATACLFFIFFRRARSDDSYVSEKRRHRDTLTSFGPLSRRPTMHGRSISEPVPDQQLPYHRTDFLRSTPPRVPDGTGANNGYSVDIRSPASGPRTPARTPKAVKALWSRSPFMHQTPSTPASTQEPLPAHLKRGTLSFFISPLRQLKKQQSMQDLRRPENNASSRRPRPEGSRSGSQETIQVLMPNNEPYTPDQRPQPSTEAPATLDSSVYGADTTRESSWESASHSDIEKQAAPAQYASSSRYPTEVFTPTRMPIGNVNGGNGGTLGTPYTPTRFYGNTRAVDVAARLDEPSATSNSNRPMTTMSSLLREAGWRTSHLMTEQKKKDLGPDPCINPAMGKRPW